MGKTKRNFKTRFNKNRKDFTTSTRKSTFSEHIVNTGHEMRSMTETMNILYFENEPKRINSLVKIEVMKGNTSDHMLNIKQNINPLYQILQSFQDQKATSEATC